MLKKIKSVYVKYLECIIFVWNAFTEQKVYTLIVDYIYAKHLFFTLFYATDYLAGKHGQSNNMQKSSIKSLIRVEIMVF